MIEFSFFYHVSIIKLVLHAVQYDNYRSIALCSSDSKYHEKLLFCLYGDDMFIKAIDWLRQWMS